MEKYQHLLIPVSVLVAGVLIGGAVMWQGAQQKSAVTTAYASAQQTQPLAPAVDVANVKTAGEPFIGSADAPVTMAYWSDYQCPFCNRNEQQVMPQLIKDYVDTGKLRIVYKDYQFLGPDSTTAGLASRAVWALAPDKFYAWHKAMYDSQDAENSGWGNKQDILALTKRIGIDAATVNQLMTANAAEYQKEMDADQAEGTAMGIAGTPGFIIGKQLIVGAQPYEQFKTAIDTALNAK